MQHHKISRRGRRFVIGLAALGAMTVVTAACVPVKSAPPAPDPGDSENPPSTLTIDPTSWAWTTSPGAPPDYIPFSVRNTGSETTGLLATAIENQAGTGEFIINHDQGFDWCTGESLAPGDQCPIYVYYVNNTGSGSATAEFVITASPGGTAKATLSGTGTPDTSEAPTLDCTDDDGDGVLDDPPALSHALVTCIDGQAFIGSCEPDYHDLNRDALDGCEYGPVPFTGPEQCDGIDNDADGQIDEEIFLPTVPNGNLLCTNAGTVEVVCAPGYTNANSDPYDGCEEPVS